MAAPELLADGEEAARRISNLKTPTDLTMETGTYLGKVEIKASSTWDNKTIISADGGSVYYTVGDKLYRAGPSDFVRDELIGAFEKAGKSAAPWITIAKAEFEFILAIVDPGFIKLGLTIATMVYLYYEHRPLFEAARKHGGKIWDCLMWIRKKCPTLWKCLRATALKAVLSNASETVSLADFARFFGLVLRVMFDAAKSKGVPASSMLKTGLAIAGKVLSFAAAIAVPVAKMSAAAIALEAKKMAEKIKKAFSDNGHTITFDDAEKIGRELILAGPEGKKIMKELEDASKEFVPAMEKLSEKIEEAL